MNTKRFKIDLPGILNVLGENLYSNPNVALREMIQNAHDGITRRVIQEDNEAQSTGEMRVYLDFVFDNMGKRFIKIITNKKNSSISIIDNGYGMSKYDIEEFLSTIGKGYTGEFKDSLSNTSDSYKLIGQFGLGFLAGFLIAEKIIIITKKDNSETGIKYIATNDGYYSIEDYEKTESGTECILYLKPEFERLLEPEILKPIVKHYTCLLEHPIYINEEEFPVNDTMLPWKNYDFVQDEYNTFINNFFNTEAMGIITLESFEHRGEIIPLEGFIFIPKYSVLSIGEFGSLLVYIRNMLITGNDKTLLPEWAKFVTGIINCPLLEPTASREDLKINSYHTLISEHLSELILNYLDKIKKSEPRNMLEIVKNHNNILKTWSLTNNDLFEILKDELIFKTNKGDITLKKYLKLSSQIYYLSENQSYQEKLLVDILNIPFIDLRYFGDENFVRKYSFSENITLNNIFLYINNLLENSSYLMKIENLDENWLSAVSYLERENFYVKILRIESSNIPLLLCMDENHKILSALEENIKNNLIPNFMENILNFEILKNERKKDTIFINYNSKLMKKIVSFKDKNKLEKILETILKFSLILSEEENSKNNLLEAFFEEYSKTFI